MLALRTTIRLDLALHRDGEGAVRKRVVLEKRAGESGGHVLLKLLGFVLHYRPGLAIEASAGQKYKPDLLLADDDGTVRLWIDCGHVGPRKLAEVLHRNRRAEVVVVKATEREARLFAASAAKPLAPALARPEDAVRLRLQAFRDGFLDDLSAAIADRGRLDVRVTGPPPALRSRPTGNREPVPSPRGRTSPAPEPPAARTFGPARPSFFDRTSAPEPPSARSLCITAGHRTVASPVIEVPFA